MTILDFTNSDGGRDSFCTRQLKENLIHLKDSKNQISLQSINKEELVDICLILIEAIEKEHP